MTHGGGNGKARSQAMRSAQASELTKPLLSRIFNRVFHTMARVLPGSRSLRPTLHRWRGVKIGERVFIGDDAYIENEYPECIEIGDDVEIGLRCVLLAHLRGPGRIVIKKNAWIGACSMLSAAHGRTLTIGEGAVVGACSVVATDVPDHAFVRPPQAQHVANAAIPLATADTYFKFLRGLRPIRMARPRDEEQPAPKAHT